MYLEVGIIPRFEIHMRFMLAIGMENDKSFKPLDPLASSLFNLQLP